MHKSRGIIFSVAVLFVLLVVSACSQPSKPTPVPTPAPTTSTPTPSPTPTPVATPPITGVVSGQCERVDYGVHCSINDELSFDHIGLARLGSDALLITCGDTSCASTLGTARDIGCTLDNDGIFCPNVEDNNRSELYDDLATYVSGCFSDPTLGTADCKFPNDWDLRNGQPFVNGVPFLLGEKNRELFAYAGQVPSDRPTFTCIPADRSSLSYKANICTRNS